MVAFRWPLVSVGGRLLGGYFNERSLKIMGHGGGGQTLVLDLSGQSLMCDHAIHFNTPGHAGSKPASFR